ncbi:RNA-binding CRS1 / YhbY (CRM) domain-containing protein [Actinidia rufa]|uniref:RNA-binding CRS1 / YhbY (CRM) domain-containing protein n=1 Tax=Actinidia rufa TaxID=165716 RepID=A0A7J0FNX3_9ERIC|nr:RNA-binding CRS1 / YhbY (CRM) domain-containing protein [Actinidia rufa]
MFIFINRTSRRRRPALSSSSARHHLSSSAATTTSSSNLHDKCSFKLPLSLHKNPNPNPEKTSTTTKKAKPPYRPPSSLERDVEKPTSSDLPLDLRFSYTESDPAVRPIGLREAKYLPIGAEPTGPGPDRSVCPGGGPETGFRG